MPVPRHRAARAVAAAALVGLLASRAEPGTPALLAPGAVPDTAGGDERPACDGLPRVASAAALANDNREPAGNVHDGVLTLRVRAILDEYPPAAPAGHETGTPLALAHVTVIDGTGAAPMPNMTILVAGDRIADVFATGAKPLPPNTAVRELPGRFVIPGLIDAHVHVSAGTSDEVLALRRTLRGGVTGVREMASNCRLLGEIATRAARGEIEAPDVYFSAHMIGPDVRTNPTVGAMVTPQALEALGPGCVQILEGTIDAVQVVSAARATGASALKIYGDLSADVVRRLTAEAHRQGLRVWAHAAVFPARPGDLVDAGVDVMSHSDLFVWEAADRLPDHYYARMDLAPFERVAPTDPAVERVLRTMARRGTVLDATLLVYEPEGAHPGRVANPQAWAAAGRWAAALTRRARELGVAVAAGTDAMGAERDGELPNLHRELELLVKNSGFSPLEAITAATRTAARALGAEDTRGTIAAGKLADLVVLRADPSADVRNTRAIELVVKRGRVIERGGDGDVPSHQARSPDVDMSRAIAFEFVRARLP